MSYLYIDLKAIIKNIVHIKSKINDNQKFCFVAKANCYGLGDRKICRAVEQIVDCFAVSCEDEFKRLHGAVKKPVIILTPIYENITKLAAMGAEISVCNKKSFECLKREACDNQNVKYKIHIVVNTGMNRYGFKDFDGVKEIVDYVQKTQNIAIVGVFTHYFDANNENILHFQENSFIELIKKISNILDVKNITFHSCSSVAAIKKPAFDMVRVGLFCYCGFDHEAITLVSKIVEIQTLKAGETAGYGGGFLANKATKLAIVHIGYADGIPRNIVKKGYVLINDKFVKIVAICMDSLLVDVTGIDVKILDEVVLIGKSESKQIFVCDVACWCDTIEHEIISRISNRVKRIYIR